MWFLKALIIFLDVFALIAIIEYKLYSAYRREGMPAVRGTVIGAAIGCGIVIATLWALN